MSRVFEYSVDTKIRKDTSARGGTFSSRDRSRLDVAGTEDTPRGIGEDAKSFLHSFRISVVRVTRAPVNRIIIEFR